MAIAVVLKSVYDDKGIRDATKSLKGLSGSLKSTLGALGVGLGLGAMVSGLKDATREAISDAKSQQILANSLKNTVHASDSMIASVEQQITKMSLASGIADDELRPAFQSLVTATGSVAKANDLMSIAMNVAADKNISVAEASTMLGKAVNGTTRGLFAMYPNLKKSSDWMGELKTQTAGASDAAANADPITRLNTIFNEMQETIGRALVPALQHMADYLASPMGQAEMQKLGDEIANVVTVLGEMLGFLFDNRDAIATIATVVTGVSVAFGLLSAAIAVNTAVTEGATVAQALFDVAVGAFDPAALAIGIGVLGGAYLVLASNTNEAATATGDYNNVLMGSNGSGWSGNMSAITSTTNQAADSVDALTTAMKNGIPTLGNWNDLIYRFEHPGSGVLKPTGDTTDKTKPEKTVKPINPKPGESYTFWKLEGGIYVWYEQIWDGKHWSKAKKMTYTDPAKQAAQDKADAAAKKRKDDADAKRKAAIQKQKDDYKSLADSVKASFDSINESIMGAFDITKMGQSSGRVMSSVKRLIDQTKKFAQDIKGLIKMNLNPDLVNQLIMAGPQAAGRLASNLLASGQGSINELSGAYTEYQGLASGIAKTGLQNMYSPGARNYNITVNTGIGDKKSLGKAIVDAIKAYEQQSGTKIR